MHSNTTKPRLARKGRMSTEVNARPGRLPRIRRKTLQVTRFVRHTLAMAHDTPTTIATPAPVTAVDTRGGRPRMRALEALTANPGKSDRVVAALAGVSHMTVRRLRDDVTFCGAPSSATAGGPPLQNVTSAPAVAPVTNCWVGRIEDITREARRAAKAAGMVAKDDLLKLASYADEDQLWAVEQIAAAHISNWPATRRPKPTHDAPAVGAGVLVKVTPASPIAALAAEAAA